jgi:hypothetical protein
VSGRVVAGGAAAGEGEEAPARQSGRHGGVLSLAVCYRRACIDERALAGGSIKAYEDNLRPLSASSLHLDTYSWRDGWGEPTGERCAGTLLLLWAALGSLEH